MKEIAQAIIKVMQTVKGIEKSMTVGSGNYSYQGVSDKVVKEIYSKAMADNGLCILPIEVKENQLSISRWVENGRTKQSVLCSVSTKYLLLHTSGESQEISGYGHGVDAQDKAAGKATTYAMKYALLYTFMTPTGKIDDTDTTHSEEHVTPQAKKEPMIKAKMTNGLVKQVVEWAKENNHGISKIDSLYEMTKEHRDSVLRGLKVAK